MIGLNSTITDIIARLKVFTARSPNKNITWANRIAASVNNSTSILSAVMRSYKASRFRLSTMYRMISISLFTQPS
ncbi:hypothetical protein O9993_08995 [Vibrio lentus]|nr:hypothetical protein [Vibrio lentus]